MAFLISSPPSITSYKDPAKVASTANLALSGVIGSIQIDGVALSSFSTGDRILLKNQGTGSENGIYKLTVSGLNYSLARSSDADTSAKLSPNSLIPVSAGALNADNIFQLTNNTVNLGTDSLVFVAVDSVALALINSLVPSQTSQANKVLATDGSASSWQYAGLGSGGFGTSNVFLGMPKPTNLSTGTENVVVGAYTTGSALSSASYNTLVGNNIQNLSTGGTNCVFGNNIYFSSGGRNSNIVIGVGSSISNDSVVAIGQSISAQTSGIVCIGTETGSVGDVYIGAYAKGNAAKNIAIGNTTNAGSGGNSIVIGSSSGKSTCSGANNTVVGADSFNGASLTTAQDNVIIGKGAGKLITTGSNNILLGPSGAALTTGLFNFIAGDNGRNLTTGSGNIIIGTNSTGYPPVYNTGNSIILGQETEMQGNNGIAIGLYARCAQDCVAIGSSAYGGSGTNQRSVTIGMQANTFSSPYSVAIGALSYAIGGNEVSVGYGAKCSEGGYNVTVGTNAGNAGSAANSVIIGALAGTTLSTGGKQTYLGSYSGKTNATGVGQVCLGYYSGAYATASDEFYLNNQDRTNTAGDKAQSLMYGVFNATASSQTLVINAALSTPYTLAVTGVATFTAAPIVSSVTASQILASGASKEVVSLSTATYPSLTELAYVKGVTSAVQTQLNSEATARAASVLLAVPAQTNKSEYVLSTDGSASYWALEGVKTGYPNYTAIFGRPKTSVDTGATITGEYNLIIGKNAAGPLTTGSENVVIGALCGTNMGGGAMAAGTGTSVLIGAAHVGAPATGLAIAIGGSAASGHKGVAIGVSSSSFSSSLGGIALGYGALAVGYGAISIGNQAGNGTYTGGSGSINIGDSAKGGSGAEYVCIGVVSGKASATGDNLLILGNRSGINLSTGGNQTYVGGYSGKTNATGVGQVCVGYYSGAYATASDEFYLNNQDRTNTAGDKAKSLMYGVFNATASSQTLAINAKVGINIAAPAVPLQVEVTALVNTSALSGATNSVIRFDESTGTIGPRPGIAWVNNNSNAKVIAAIESYVQAGFAGEIHLSTYNYSDSATQKHLSLVYDNSVELGKSSNANLRWATDGAGSIGTSSSSQRPKDVNLTGQISIGTTSATNSQFSADNANYFVAITDTGGIGGRKGILWRGPNSSILAGIQPTVAAGYPTDLDFYTYSGSASAMALRISAAGSIKAIIGDVTIETAGKGLKIKEGSNAKMGTSVLVGGTVTVSNTSVTATSRIMLTAQDNGGTIGFLSISARTAATSFTILSSSASDTSTVAWMIIEPA